MANGEVITRDIGYAIIKVNGFETVDEIVFAHSGDLNLLGSRTLEGFGAIVDARKKQGSQLRTTYSICARLRVFRIAPSKYRGVWGGAPILPSKYAAP